MLPADEYEFIEAPIGRATADLNGHITNGKPEGDGWFLFQVVPLAHGGGSHMGGYAGQDHRIAGVSTSLIGIWARPCSVKDSREELAQELERAAREQRRDVNRLDYADFLDQQAVAARQGWLRPELYYGTIRGWSGGA